MTREQCFGLLMLAVFTCFLATAWGIGQRFDRVDVRLDRIAEALEDGE